MKNQIKSRKQAAKEIHECMLGYEKELSLSYSTIYRYIYKKGDCWVLRTGCNTSHYDYSTSL